MSQKKSYLAMFILIVCVISLTGCGKENERNINKDDSNNIVATGVFTWKTTDNSNIIILDTGDNKIDTTNQVDANTPTGDVKKNNTGTAINSKIFTSKNFLYKVPSNKESSITVIAKINTNTKIIQEITIQNISNDPITAKYQKSFNDKIGTSVVGKTLADAKISKLNGSSLTSAAFNNAIDDIKSQI